MTLIGHIDANDKSDYRKKKLTSENAVMVRYNTIIVMFGV